MELYAADVARTLRRYGWILTVMVVLGGVVGYLSIEPEEETYAANALLMILPSQSERDPPYNRLRASQGYIETYRRLITSKPMLERVSERLDLPYGVDELEGQILAVVPQNTTLIEVYVEHRDPEQAALIATTVVEEFEGYLDSLLDADESPAEVAVPVEVIEPAQVPAEPARPRPVFGVLLGAILGLLLGTILLGGLLLRPRLGSISQTLRSALNQC